MAGLATQVAQWILPYALYVRLREWRNAPPPLPPVSEAVRSNAALRNIHVGRRAFIVGNGPSISHQDLFPLKHEIVFTVSSGYHHPDYLSIAPRYHCVPQISSSRVSQADKKAWLKEMHAGTGQAEIFLSETEAPMVREEGLFPGRVVRYLSLIEAFESFPRDQIIDIARHVPGVQSVPIMVLMIAMYMGLSPIYLIGVEHDHFRTGRYSHFYEPTVLKGKDSEVSADGVVTTPLYEDFVSLTRLWGQYRHLREIASANGIEVLNATAGGALDEFPRVELGSLFS